MRIFYGLLALVLIGTSASAQTSDTLATKAKKVKAAKTSKPQEPREPKEPKAPKVKPDFSKLNLKNRANDHLMIQLGYDNWAGAPDSLRITGIGRHFNFYGMYDMPFKTDPRWSVGVGAGLGSSNIYFSETQIRLTANSSQTKVLFKNVSDTTHFKKYKLTNIWVEAPVELRFVADPFNTNKSFKVAIGAKVGTMISAYTKGKNLLSSSDNTVYGTKYTVKEKDKTFFNSTRLAATARIGMGAISIDGSYQILSLFKEGSGPVVRPYSIGITISGL